MEFLRTDCGFLFCEILDLYVFLLDLLYFIWMEMQLEPNPLLSEGESDKAGRALGWKSVHLDSDPSCGPLCL